MNHLSSHSFLNDKHLSPLLPPTTSFFPSSSSFSSSSTHHPSLCFFLCGWVEIFPWDSGGGELSRACYFIFPNKAGNMFRPPHCGFTDETLWQKLRHAAWPPCSHIPSVYSVILSCTPALSLHRSLILLFMALLYFHIVVLLKSINAVIYNQTKLLHKIINFVCLYITKISFAVWQKETQ